MKSIYPNHEKNSKNDEIRLSEFLKTFDLLITKIDSKDNEFKSPDFLVESKDGFCFYCEVKSILSDTDEGLLHNTKFNKLERKIILSYKQFLSINKNHFAPNILVFISNDFRINYKSLEELFQGFMKIGDENYDIKKYRDGHGFEAVRNIDLFIWFTEKDYVQYFFNPINSRFTDKLRRIFNINKIDKNIRI